MIDLEVGFTAKEKKEFTPSAHVEEVKSSAPSSPSTSAAAAASNKAAESQVSIFCGLKSLKVSRKKRLILKFLFFHSMRKPYIKFKRKMKN